MKSDSPLLTLLLAVVLALVSSPWSSAMADDEDSSPGQDAPADDEGDEEDDEAPNISREEEDDVDSWSFEGDKPQEKVEAKEEPKAPKELPPEPRRYGNSGNWSEVTVECMRCPTLLNQNLGIEEPMVMRRFFDYIQVSGDRKSGKFVYPSASESRTIGVIDQKKRLILWQYTSDVGSRLTDTYAVVWDLDVKAGGGLLYGRRYEVQAWTDSAYESFEGGYRAKQSFIPVSKLSSYPDLAPIKALTADNNRFQVGEASRIAFAGYAAFVRSDVDVASIQAEKEALKEAAEREAKRLKDQQEWFKTGQAHLDDKDWESALEAFLKARELGLDTLDLTYELGFTYYMLKDYPNAKDFYQQVLEQDRRDTDVRYNLARIFEKEKDWDSAIRQYQAILKFDPDDQGSRDRLELLKAAREMAN